jgi:hypothetical protein
MFRSRVCLSLLPLCLLTFGQTTESTSDHAKARTKRQARYIQPKIISTDDAHALEITANDPRPVDSVLDALALQHGWRINYEDPHYGKADLVDDTAPSWLLQHPDGNRVHAVAGGTFNVKIPTDGLFPLDPTQIISAVIEAYKANGNPGRFELRATNREWFDVVATAAGDGPQKAVLDTVMSFDTGDMVDATINLKNFCEKLSGLSGQAVVFEGTGPPSSNRLNQAQIELHAQNQPAREILRQMFKQVGSTDTWRLLYDADSNQFVLRFR